MSSVRIDDSNFFVKFVFVFFVHKKYSHCIIKLRLNRWCHMDYSNDVLTTFLKVSVALLSMQGQKALGFNQKYINVFQKWTGLEWY